MRARVLPGCNMAASTDYKHRVLGVAILHPGNTHALIGKFCNYVFGRTSFRECIYGDWSPYIQSPWLLPRSTAIGWLNEEDTMSSQHLWWGPFTSTFCEHCSKAVIRTWELAEPKSKIMFLSTSCQSGAKQTTNLKSPNISFKILPFFL